jgi:prepilin-type N-terminal cleavage/methylation domain-containing protein
MMLIEIERPQSSTSRTGFTLIELLVVIAIIAVLMAILMPSLQAVKRQASASTCMSNTKNLSMGWYMYMDDNDGRIMSANDGNPYRWIDIPETENGQKCTNTQTNPEVTDEDEIRGIEKGKLYPYVKNHKAYRCPGNLTKSLYDQSRIYVSYSVPFCLNGRPNENDSKQIKNYNKIKNPSIRYNFVEATETRNWNSGHHFVIASPEETGRPNWGWWGPMSINHGDSSVLGYCDGHAEKRKWRDKYTIERVDKIVRQGGGAYGHDYPPADQQADIQFMAKGWPFQYREN